MDITFHYFAVKTLARLAGFEEASAQRIAELSEYVDDYAPYAYQRHSYVPQDLRVAPYDVYMPGQGGSENRGFNFNPSTTGFSSMFDYSVLTIANNQKNYVLPFHFMPFSRAEVEQGAPAREAHWRNDGPQDSIITQEMANASNQYARDPASGLIRIGMLLHIYADTCAHEGFSGYSRSENRVELVRASSNIPGQPENLLDRFAERILHGTTGWVADAIAIGHGFAGEAPDCTFATWQIRRGGQIQPAVDNTERFLRKSREILDYLCRVRGYEPLPEADWTPIQVRLQNAFLYDPAHRDRETSLFDALASHWTQCFTEDRRMAGNSYHYDPGAVFGCQVLSTGIWEIEASSDFYSFIRAAQNYLIALYGPRPRSSKASLPDLNFHCEREGENGFAVSEDAGGEGFVNINGQRDLSRFVRFNNGGCVFEIRILRQVAQAYDWIIWVDAQGPSIFGGAGHLTFTDASGDKYRLAVFRSVRYSHLVRYNSRRPQIVKIEWSNYI